MSDRPVLWAVGTDCPEDNEQAFVEWYGTTHIPMVLKAPGFLGAARYRAADRVPGQPKFLVIYELAGEAVIGGFLDSPEIAAARADRRQTWGDGGFTVVRREFFRPLPAAYVKAPVLPTEHLLLLFGTECPADRDQEYNDWVDRVHIPMVLGIPGSFKAARYAAVNRISGQPQYLQVQELESPAVLKRPEMAPIRDDKLARWGETGYTTVRREFYQPIR